MGYMQVIRDAANDPRPATAGPKDGRGDFDFLYGRWMIASRRLKRHFAGLDPDDPQNWDAFAGRVTCGGHLDGIANIDEMHFPYRGFSGMSIRLYDIAAAAWRLWWVCSTDGLLQRPAAGRFQDGTGLFLGDAIDDGRPVKLRYRWTADEIAPRWEQAYSLDNGISWETNWRMDFTRVR